MRRNVGIGKLICGLILFFALAAGAWTGSLLSQRPQESQDTTKPSVTIRYFDMGQANASLVESDGQYMLIDTGLYEDVEDLKKLLEQAGVKTLAYVVGTHPHADHIGSLATVIREYEVETLLMPDVEADSKTYRVAVEAANKKQLSITHPKVGEVYELGQVSFQILAPGASSYEELNDYSIALRLSCQDIDFLWTADAEAVSEKEMLNSGLMLEAEVYHVGHHGSASSSGWEFLEKVNPQFAVISCGRENEYGYPHKEVKKRLEDLGAEILVTSEHGTIQMTCEGNKLNCQVSRGGK